MSASIQPNESDCYEETSRYWIPDVSLKPLQGARFTSLDQAYQFYKTYAKNGGFSVRKSAQHFCNSTKKVLLKYFVCSKQGRKTNNLKIDTLKNVGKTINKRKVPSCRTNCKAEIRLKAIPGNLYEIYFFEEKHNHILVEKDDMPFLNSSRDLTYLHTQFLQNVSKINIGPVRGFKIMKELYGGFEKVGVTAVDCKNFRRDINTFIGDYDADMVIQKLTYKAEFVPGFTFEYCTDEEGDLSGLFWADAEAKRTYSIFGDIMSFDATFRTNKYKMVFIPFTGIDNHNRCVTFGAGLVSKENIESYKWLLKSFKDAFGPEPRVVVTDQDPAIKQAIEAIFTSSRHRYCMWHIMEKLTTKVGTSICNNTTFKQRLCNIVWTDSIEPVEFEEKWVEIINEFLLQDNKWLSDIFGMKDRWIPAYYRDTPLSGLMRTSSRSESENHFFGKLTSSDLTLVEFVSHFDTAMDAQRYTHRKNDHDTRYTNPDLKTNSEIEKQASLIYTRTIFFEVQEEIYASFWKCMSVNFTRNESYEKYVIRDIYSAKESHDEFEVDFNRGGGIISCACKQYERYGLLCRHIFYVLRICRVKEFPKRYIHTRWKRDVVPPISDDSSSEFTTANENDGTDQNHTTPPSSSNGTGNDGREAIIRQVYQNVDECINRLVADNEKLISYLDKQKDLALKVLEDIEACPLLNKDDLIGSFLGVEKPLEGNKATIGNPKNIRNKGCGKKKRLIGVAEKIKIKKKRLCRKCNQYKRHDSRNCDTDLVEI